MPFTVSGDDVDFGAYTIRVKEVAGMTGNLTNTQKAHTKIFDVWRLDNVFPSIVDCYDAVLSVAPSVFDNLALNGIRYREDDSTRHIEFSCDYDSTPPEATLRWSFDSTGGTIRLTTSRGTTSFVRPGRTAPDFKGAIGVKQTGKDAEPEGVDITIPGLKLTATYRWPRNTFGLTEAKAIAGITGFVNSLAFKTFDPGEILFLGATGDIIPDIPTDVQYHFLASKNVSGLTIGEVTAIAKLGHQYLWVAFEAEEDTAAKKLVQRPLAVYVEDVYPSVDLNTALGI